MSQRFYVSYPLDLSSKLCTKFDEKFSNVFWIQLGVNLPGVTFPPPKKNTTRMRASQMLYPRNICLTFPLECAHLWPKHKYLRSTIRTSIFQTRFIIEPFTYNNTYTSFAPPPPKPPGDTTALIAITKQHRSVGLGASTTSCEHCGFVGTWWVRLGSRWMALCLAGSVLFGGFGVVVLGKIMVEVLGIWGESWEFGW